MKNYNEDFFLWLEKVRELKAKSHEDLPTELQEEFEKLLFLADIPFRRSYGQDPDALGNLLRMVLWDEEYFASDGTPLQVVLIEEGRVFESPVNHRVVQPVLYAEDDRGRSFVFLYCDWRGPHIGAAAAVFDAIHASCREKGVPFEELPDVYFIFITDYDLCRQGQKIIRLDREEEEDLSTVTDEEWRRRGCDPNEPDPNTSKWHTIFFNATIVS